MRTAIVARAMSRSLRRVPLGSTFVGLVKTSKRAPGCYKEGDHLGPRDIGVLAGIGLDKVKVRPRPRVVVISTGSELVDPGLELSNEQQIFDSNSYLLAAATKAAGADVFRVGQVSDDHDALKQLIGDQLLRADLILTTGGVSQGDFDIVKAVMPEMGACDFAQVAMQPGKPQGFGLIGHDRVPMIMLPGNPVSAFVSFEAFVRPGHPQADGRAAVRAKRGQVSGGVTT